MNELVTILMSWAVTISGYAMPPELPEVVVVPHEFFVKAACYGKECNVHGWYNDKDIIYLDDRLNLQATMGSAVLVHELVHYLQHKSGEFESGNCEDAIVREREAYSVQNVYLFSQGSVGRVKSAPKHCKG